MTSVLSTIQDVHTVTDLGVNLGYLSRNYKSQVLNYRYRSDPVAQIDDLDITNNNPQSGGQNLKYHPCAREVYIPPKYDKLLSSSNSSDLVKTFVKSEIHIHEATHDFLTNREKHIYVPSRLFTLGATVSWLARKTSTNTAADEDFVRRIVNEVRMIRGSEYAQEAIAIQNQRRWLQQQNNTGQFDPLLDNIQYDDIIDDSLSEGVAVTDSDTVSPVHAMADWILQNRIEEWDIDILKYCFRFVIDTWKMPGPDSVLFLAASIPDGMLKQCDKAQQFELLKESIEDNGTLGSAFEHQEGTDSWEFQLIESDDASPEGIKNIEPKELLRKQFRYRIKKAVNNGYYERIPLLANSYPGVPSGHTLSKIVNALYATTDSSGRQLYIEPAVYKWSKKTKLLDIATTLWEIRSNIFLPIVRLLVQESQTSWSNTINAAERYLDGSDSPYAPLYMDFIGGQELNPLIQSIKELQRELYDQYDVTIEQLRSLGKAIIAEDKDEIRTYF